jgi:hypothetical protein
MAKFVTFHKLGDVPVYYARVNAAYGDLSKTTSRTIRGRTRRLAPAFLKRLSACIAEVYWVSYGSLGPLGAVVSGGAQVRESDKRGPRDRHVRGIAFDLGGLHWEQDLGGDYPSRQVLTCLGAAALRGRGEESPLYLGVEACLRRHFGTVLGIHHNAAHQNHWHLDTGTRVGFWSTGFGSKTRIVFLQAAVAAVWGQAIAVDGDYGPKTRKAVREVRAQLSLGPFENLDGNAWQRFLLLTAMAGINR